MLLFLAEWDCKFEEYKDFFDKRQLERVNEALRPQQNKSDDFDGLGYQGSFKKLDVD